MGVNSFKGEGEALNFAVSVGEVHKFLKRNSDRRPHAEEGGSKAPESCNPELLGTDRAPDEPADRQFWDWDCDGKADGHTIIPDDPNEPSRHARDTNGDGRVDTLYIDVDRDGEIDRSAFDTDGDGKPDLIGFHSNGELRPYRVEPMSLDWPE